MLIDDLTRLGTLDDDEIDLAEAALVLGALDRPEADLTPYRLVLQHICSEVFVTGTDAETPAQQAAVLRDVLSARFGFSGDRETYDDPANANLLDVIDRRKGLPVALSILYIAAARAVGWTADGLNLPAHFLIRVGGGAVSVLQDPFNDGVLVTGEQLEALLRRVTGQATQLQVSHLEPLSNRAILIRLLNNIAARAEQADDLARALTVHERMTAIAPMMTALWWERARLEQGLGRVAAARSSLSAMLETTRNAAISEQIRRALEGLARSIN